MDAFIEKRIEFRPFDFLRARARESVHFLHRLLIHPRSSHEDRKRQEFILNVILLGVIIVVTILDASVLYDAGDAPLNQDISFAAFSCILLFFVFLLAMSRAGHSRIAAYFFIAVYFTSVTYAAWQWGVSLPESILNYAFLVIISSILIGTGFSFAITVFIGAVMSFFAFLEEKAGTVAPWRIQPIHLDDGIEYAVVLFLITLVSWLSNREIGRSLARARKSESALREERDKLEITVEERTRELKTAQFEQVSQMYRFVEFGKMASGLFHDLINPFTALSLSVKQLQEKPTHVSETLERMEGFLHTIRRQLDSERTEESFSLSECVRDAASVLSYKARHAGVTIENLATQDIKTHGSPLKFYQVATNLVSNAIDSYARGSAAEHSRFVKVKLFSKGNRAVLEVEDSGCGISPALKEKIFEPFFTTKDREEGFGIGLSTTKSIVEKDLQGTISVESEEGKGAKFVVSFPLRGRPLPLH